MLVFHAFKEHALTYWDFMTCRKGIALITRLAGTDREMVHHLTKCLETTGINAGIYTLFILAGLNCRTIGMNNTLWFYMAICVRISNKPFNTAASRCPQLVNTDSILATRRWIANINGNRSYSPCSCIIKQFRYSF